MPSLQVASVSNIDFGATHASAAAVGQILNTTAAPASGDTVTLVDYKGKSQTFEFTLGVPAPGNIAVAIGSIAATRTNLIAAINASAIRISAAPHATAGQTTLTQQANDVKGNTVIAVSFATPANATTTQFAGGLGDTTRAQPVTLQAKEGGAVNLTLTNEVGSENPITLSLDVSDDNIHFRPTTVLDQGSAITNVVLGLLQSRTYGLVIGQGQFLRLTATGPGRGTMQFRGVSFVVQNKS